MEEDNQDPEPRSNNVPGGQTAGSSSDSTDVQILMSSVQQHQNKRWKLIYKGVSDSGAGVWICGLLKEAFWLKKRKQTKSQTHLSRSLQVIQ
ncbi:uncharacterized protein LOC123980224 isoform X8 [Micropterus dolomieu]|uniref:uncharacterized protein LOC123980224 isoform X8 n=1 Tax=Micropterus dolomieu TaxID=147949 RepID=UPI001E8EA796|nr:uncharacterized protein LOC123980224 isoform X8 [Micropterus dolomieu]